MAQPDGVPAVEEETLEKQERWLLAGCSGPPARAAWAVGVAAVALASVSVACLHSSGRLAGGWGVVSDSMGYIYTAAWSVSFWPQIFYNASRRSVRGLSLDFQALNLLGFACYAAYNVALAAVPAVRAQYCAAFSTTRIPVDASDVLFSVHALLATAITVAQCLTYDRAPDQTFNTPISRVTLALGVACVCATGVVSAAQAAGLSSSSGPASVLDWVHLLLALSACKLGVSLVKYAPQIWLNARRQSTVGWSISNVLLDFTGGALSMGQLLLQCIVTGDWTLLRGNPVKAGLGLVALTADVIFAVQHFVLYRGPQAAAAGVDERQPLAATAAEEASTATDGCELAAAAEDDSPEEQ